jgi:HSP20 family protein
MNNNDISPYDWFNRFFANGFRNMGRGFLDIDPFKEMDEMQREMESMFGRFEQNTPKELVREYQTSEGRKVREIGPIVYGYSMTIGPDGKPQVREFGNVKSFGRGGAMGSVGGNRNHPQITVEREPLADINTTEKDVKVILEIPGIRKEDIKVSAFEGTLEVLTNDPKRKYHKIIDLPEAVDLETAQSSYNNGILEITFNKKNETKPKGKEIKID